MGVSKTKKKELSLQQKEFARQYIVDFNATQAAIRAKYSEKTAEVQGSRLLSNDNIQSEIAKLQAKAVKKEEITIERVLQEEKRIAFSDFREFFKDLARTSPSELPEDVARAVSGFDVIEYADKSVKYKYRFWDKGKALERLSRYLGMFEKDNLQRSPIEAVAALLEAVDGKTRGLPALHGGAPGEQGGPETASGDSPG